PGALAQELEDIGHDEAASGGGKAVFGPRLLGQGERRARGVDRHDLRGPAERGPDPDRSGICKRVQHAAARGERTHARAALALVEEEAGLLPVQDVDQEARAVLLDRQARRRLLAGEDAARAREPLLRAHRALAALEDAARREPLAET